MGPLKIKGSSDTRVNVLGVALKEFTAVVYTVVQMGVMFGVSVCVSVSVCVCSDLISGSAPVDSRLCMLFTLLWEAARWRGMIEWP